MEALVLRSLHLVAAAVLVGVPLVTAYMGHGTRRAEWLFWPAVAVLVVGGLSNLGTIGQVPAPGDPRGLLLTGKIVLLVLLLLVSAARLGRSVSGRPTSALWLASGVLTVSALFLAVMLAHG